jgi:hypothetical protein
MRRTFNDLMRIAKVEAIVTMSVSGHLTDRMREHYSTVTPDEQRESIGNVRPAVRTTKWGAQWGARSRSGEQMRKAARGVLRTA